jgi:hypothetical protein
LYKGIIMPSVALASLVGAGTFSTAVVPATNTPLTVAATGTVTFAPGSSGYVTGVCFDSISGQVVCGFYDMIRAPESAAGSKSFNIGAVANFPNAANIRIAISTRALDGASPANAPALSAASLMTFAASPNAV